MKKIVLLILMCIFISSFAEKIETFDNWFDCYSKYYDEDFKDRYESVEAVVQDTYEGGYYTKEESEENGCVIFSIKKHRVAHLNSTACY